MVEFSIFKIPVRVEVSFWITIGLLGVLWNQGTPSDLLVNAGLFVFAAFLSILIHELGHALMIRKFKLPTQIVLSSFGGYATYPPGYLTRLQSFLVTLAGPLLQATVGVLVLYTLFDHVPNNKMLLLVFYFVNVSIIWAVFNCVPVLPLDGGRMVEAALGPRRIKTTLLISVISASLLAVLGFVFKQPFVAIFMIMFAWQNYQAYEQYKR